MSPICSCADCTLGHLLVKYKRRSTHGHVEEKTCPLTLCSLFSPPSLHLCPSCQLQNPFACTHSASAGLIVLHDEANTFKVPVYWHLYHD